MAWSYQSLCFESAQFKNIVLIVKKNNFDRILIYSYNFYWQKAYKQNRKYTDDE